jgi:hypothetical protein
LLLKHAVLGIYPSFDISENLSSAGEDKFAWNESLGKRHRLSFSFCMRRQGEMKTNNSR